jgi:hypothetical protein
VRNLSKDEVLAVVGGDWGGGWNPCQGLSHMECMHLYGWLCSMPMAPEFCNS